MDPGIWCVTDVIVISQKNQNFEKMNKMSRDIIILHMCTKN